jgi:hypothetical protein
MTKKPKPSVTAARQCKQLTTEIKKHAAGARSGKNHSSRVKHVLACGRALSKLRDLLEHGRWSQWLEKRCALNRMTANRYMRLATHAKRLDRNMSIREAYIAAGVIVPKN